MEIEVKKLRKDLNEAIQTRDLYNVSATFFDHLFAVFIVYCSLHTSIYELVLLSSGQTRMRELSLMRVFSNSHRLSSPPTKREKTLYDSQETNLSRFKFDESLASRPSESFELSTTLIVGLPGPRFIMFSREQLFSVFYFFTGIVGRKQCIAGENVNRERSKSSSNGSNVCLLLCFAFCF